MMNEVDEMSAASRGSHAAAWAVEHGGDIVYVAIRAHDAQEWAAGGPVDVVPLYRQPQPTLTDEEREAVAAGLGALERLYEDSPPISKPIYEQHAPKLRALLERTK